MESMDTAPRAYWSSTTTPDVLASLERGLRLSGFEVATAVDGAEALRSATETWPDAIVLDINMPVLDGVSVVTAPAPWTTTCRCALSARSRSTTAAGLEAGADDYLVKPLRAGRVGGSSQGVAATPWFLRDLSSETIQVGPLEVDIPGRRAGSTASTST